MQLLLWLLCSCIALASSQSHNVTKRDAGSSKRVVCYYTNWSVYRPGTAKFSPQNINPYLCTHLIYAFGGLSRENGLRPYDKYQDIEQGGYAKFTGLKTYNKQLKTMLAIGGWNEGSARFSSLVADEERRAEFVKNVIRFLRQNHFDGLDLDWEYPAFRDGGKPRDRDNYAMLVQELREEFDRETAKTGRPRLLLTMAVPAGIEYIDKGFDVPKLNRYLDFMNILSYDYHSAFEPSVNHHSPLFPLEEDSEYNFDSQLSIDYTINHYLELGADRDKLVLGIPTYGRSYTLFNPLANEVGAPADGPGEQGDATREKGYLAYYEICEFLQSDEWKVEKPNPNAMGPYAYKGNQWVGYDDEDIVRLKARYVSENNLGGIMFWAIDNDDFRGKCHGRPYPLIEAAKEAMLKSSGLSNEVVSSNRKQRPRPRPTSATNTRVRTSDTNTRNRDTNTSSRRRNKNKNRSSTTTTTTTSTTTPKYNYPVTTPEPPTTPDPGSDFKCEDEGFFPHPRDCKKYFWCLDSGPSNLGIVAHQFTCPSGLVFNKAADSCDYARNVICKIKGASKAEGGPSTKSPPITAATSRTTKFSSPTTTSTTTTTTTPPPPEEEDEYEDYEDEEVVESHEDVEEDPKAIQELINLIKKLGGIEQLEKQLQAQEKNSAGAPGGISKSLYERVLSRNVNRNNNNDRGPTVLSRSTTVSPDASTRYTSIFRNRPVGPQNEGLEGLEEIPSRFERPQYVTIKRDRPSTVAPDVDEDEEDFEEDDDVPVDDNEEEEVKPRGRDYVNIRKTRPERPEYADTTTSKYVVIERRKPTPEPEQEEEEEDIQSDDKSPEEESVSSPKPTRRTYQTRLSSTEETSRVPLRSGKLNVINKEEEVELSTKQDVEIETETTTPQVITTSKPRRQPGTLFTSRQRQRGTTNSVPFTTAVPPPTEVTAKQGGGLQRRVIKRRKYGPRAQDNDASPTDVTPLNATIVDTDKGDAVVSPTNRTRKFSFPKRRASTSTTAATPVNDDAQVQPSAFVEESQPLEQSEDLPDLANVAVAALTNLATPDGGFGQDVATSASQDKDWDNATKTPGSISRHMEVTAMDNLSEDLLDQANKNTEKSVTLINTKRVRGSGTFRGRQKGRLENGASPVVGDSDDVLRTSVLPASRKLSRYTTSTSPRQASTTPSPSPTSSPLRRQPLRPRPYTKLPSAPKSTEGAAPLTRKTPPPAILDYEYYDDDDQGFVESSPKSNKVMVHGDGYIECLDQGSFPHPYSCKKFISCAKMENGGLLGWEYTCPKQLSFDPVGGICNWSSGLGCKE